jgi:hypothetical protein
LDFGFWILDFGSLEFGFQIGIVLKIEFGKLTYEITTKSPIQNPKSKIQN